MEQNLNTLKTLKFSDLKRKTFFKLSTRIHLGAILVISYYAFISFHNGFFASVITTLIPLLGFLISAYVFIVKRNYLAGAYIVYILLGTGIIVISYLEGLMSGYYWFLLTLIFALPYVIRREIYFKKHTNILYSLTFLFLFISFAISPMYSEHYNELTREQVHYRFILNSILSFLLIMIFSLQALSHNKYIIKKIFTDKEFAENEKDRRTRVLSNLGHELRTQINSINGITQLILGGDTNEVPNKKYFEILNHCNDNMLLLVNDMLDIHKIESGRFELFNEPKLLFEFLNKITVPFINKAEEKNLKLNSKIDKNLKEIVVDIDEKRLAQVIYNLISNAIKFTEQGNIVFSVDVINSNENNVGIQFIVKDSGIGIAPKNLSKVFESFQQIKNETNPIYGGTGLGLAISQSIINAMGSEIKVESKLNEGTCFKFLLTLKRAVLPSATIVDKEAFIFKPLNTTVLVVEDNMISMMYAKKLLDKYVFKLYQGTNGLEAIEAIKTHKDIDIVLLDLEMPKMNGFKAINHIKKYRPNVTVIAFTANIPSAEIIDKLDKLGFDDILSKPFNKHDLYTILKEHVEKD